VAAETRDGTLQFDSRRLQQPGDALQAAARFAITQLPDIATL
jgi:hypothetical protein